jgi:hypothetical protein
MWNGSSMLGNGSQAQTDLAKQLAAANGGRACRVCWSNWSAHRQSSMHGLDSGSWLGLLELSR